MLNIFISHAWDDKVRNQFGEVYQELEGYNLWIDKKGLQSGETIDPQLEKAINEADVFLLLWSLNVEKSKAVQFEISKALQLKKPMAICVIANGDEYEKSGQLQGRLYFDLQTKGDESPVLGWMKVKYFLTSFWIEKTKSRLSQFDEPKRREAEEMLKNLEATQTMLENNISLMQDTMHRINKGAENRDRNNPYMVNMMNSLIAEFGKESSNPEEKQIAEVMMFSKQAFAQYSDDTPETKKKREALIIEKIKQIDPDEKNTKLAQIKNVLVQNIPFNDKTANKINLHPDASAHGDWSVTLQTITKKLADGNVPLNQLEEWKRWCEENQSFNIGLIAHLKKFIENEIVRLNRGGKPVSFIDFKLVERAIERLDDAIAKKKDNAYNDLFARIKKYGGLFIKEKIIHSVVSGYLKYVTTCPQLLRELMNEAKVSEFVAVKEATSHVVEYLEGQDHSLEMRKNNLEGYFDDAYIINQTVQLLIEADLVAKNSFSLDFISAKIVNSYVSFILNQQTKAKLDELLLQIRNMIGLKKKEINWGQIASVVIGAAVFGSFIPLQQGFVNQNAGNSNAPDDGNNSPYFEDRMAAMSAKYGGLNMHNTNY